MECTKFPLSVEFSHEKYFNRQFYKKDKHITYVALASIETGKYGKFDSDDQNSKHTLIMRRLLLKLEHSFTQKIQMMSEKQTKQMETLVCQVAETEQCVQNLWEQYTSSQSPSLKTSVNCKRKIWMRWWVVLKRFFKPNTTVVLAMCTVEHMSKAYKYPGSGFLGKCHSSFSE